MQNKQKTQWHAFDGWLTKIGGIILLQLFGMSGEAQTKYDPSWNSLDQRSVPTWFEDAKFGIFVHWGLYSVPAWAPTLRDGGTIYDCYAEWYWRRLTGPREKKSNRLVQDFHATTYGAGTTYQDFAFSFRTELFDATTWAKLFESSGAKYVVLTAKHHDGFALWPSSQSWNWNSMDVGPHRDLVGEVSVAVKKQGLRMGFYYSLFEWYHPLYKSDFNAYVKEHMLPQLKDLVTRYAPDVLWADGEWDHTGTEWHSQEFLAWLFNESTVRNSVAINDRWGKETRSAHGGYYTTEYDLVHDSTEQKDKPFRAWEECRAVGFSFGYNRNENLADYATSTQLIHTLIGKVAQGGNLLLDVGATADGRIPIIMQQRLQDIGYWLKVNGEAIYGTRKWQHTPSGQSEITYTRKEKNLYTLCKSYPTGIIVIPHIQKPTRVTMLGFAKPLSFTYKNGDVILTLPRLTPEQYPCEHAWVIKLEQAL